MVRPFPFPCGSGFPGPSGLRERPWSPDDSSAMKKDLHPSYNPTTISCTCGAVYETRSTVKDLRVGICAQCHPFFTGETRFVDTAGRVDKFAKRYGSSRAARATRPKLG